MNTETESGGSSENHGGTLPDVVQNRERLTVAALAVTIVIAAIVGWATIPSDAELLERASTADGTRARVRAMNALVVRGYWDERPLTELKDFLDASPPELRQFVTDMHGSVLRPR